MIGHRIAAIGLAVTMCACARVPASPSVGDRDPLRGKVVADVVRVLDAIDLDKARALVPAHPSKGAFDVALLAALRAEGYVIGNEGAPGIRFSGDVHAIEGITYRVVVRIGEQTLARVWVADGARAYPGGAWARQE